MSLSIIVASSGRPTLARALESASSQMVPGDELLLSVNDNAPWGHAARNELMSRATGQALVFLDDDDAYLPGGLDAVRAALADEPGRVHLFKMRYGASSAAPGAEVWTVRELVEGQVSTQTIVAPNYDVCLGRWGDRYAGDFDFVVSTCELHSHEPIWHEDVIAVYRP